MLYEVITNPAGAGRLYSLALGLLFILPVAFWAEVVAINYAELTGSPFPLFLRNVKGLLLWIMVFGTTIIATTILRPNVREICRSFLQEKKDSLQKV